MKATAEPSSASKNQRGRTRLANNTTLWPMVSETPASSSTISTGIVLGGSSRRLNKQVPVQCQRAADRRQNVGEHTHLPIRETPTGIYAAAR